MSDPRPQSPLFTKSYDFLLWLIPLALKFPRSQRFLLAERLCALALEFYDAVLESALEPDQASTQLRRADKLLTKIRLYIRLSYDLHCINLGQFEHAARQVDELGRLIGGWQRKEKRRQTVAA